MRNPFKRKPKGLRFPNGIPRVTATGGSFSVGKAKDIPYCATPDEINRYLQTEFLVADLERIGADDKDYE